MFDAVTGADLLALTVAVAAACILISTLTGRGRSRQVNALRNENRRLKHMLADAMLERDQPRNARSIG